jgi:hypothetical protein
LGVDEAGGAVAGFVEELFGDGVFLVGESAGGAEVGYCLGNAVGEGADTGVGEVGGVLRDGELAAAEGFVGEDLREVERRVGHGGWGTEIRVQSAE